MTRESLLPSRALPDALRRRPRVALHLAGLGLAATLAALPAHRAHASALTEGGDFALGKHASEVWPADIVRSADDFLRDHPGDVQAEQVRQRAQHVAELLRGRDISLFRTAFQSDLGSDERNADLHRAALGDPAAAMRVAHLYGTQDQSPPSPSEAHRYVGWLQLAAKLGSDRAAYELALHFRREGEPLLAASYEAQAVAMGFHPPAALDNIRK